MSFSQQILFFLSAIGAFNGILLSIYLFFFTKKKYLPNYFLAALLLALSLRIGKSVLLYFDFNHTLPKVYLQIGLSACFFIGPMLYYFLKSSVAQITKTLKKWNWILLTLLLFILTVGVIFPYQTHPEFWNKYFVRFIYAQWFAYIIASAFVIKGLFKKIIVYKISSLKPAEIWLSSIFLGNLVIFISYLLGLTVRGYSIYLSGSIAFSFILYVAFLALLFRKKTDDLFATNQKYGNKKVNEEDANLLVEKLKKVMNEEELYKNSNLTVIELAKVVGTSSHQLSQILNDNLGKSFTTFINEYRIEDACKMILSNQQFTLEGIGYEVGFNSKSTFFATFKKIKMVTPAQYLQSTEKL